MKNTRTFYLKNFIFFVTKFSVYLNRHAFVMFIFSFLQTQMGFQLKELSELLLGLVLLLVFLLWSAAL